MTTTTAASLQREFDYSNHQHVSNGEWQHIVEANRREFWISRCKHCGLGLTRRTKPKKRAVKKEG
jgi:hypothetical protein